MRINVLFLTADRSCLTKKTVNTFLEFNDRDDFNLMYGDDGSKDDTHKFMESVGIECVFKHNRRMGCSESSEELVQKAARKYPTDLTLYMQNDWATVRTLPLDVITELFSDEKIGWARLFGKHKSPGDTGVGSSHNGKVGRPLCEWRPLTILEEQLETADIHWCYGPCITRTNLLTDIVKDVQKEAHCIANAIKTGKLTARFLNNLANHIGIQQSTPQGKFGKGGGSFHREAKR